MTAFLLFIFLNKKAKKCFYFKKTAYILIKSVLIIVSTTFCLMRLFCSVPLPAARWISCSLVCASVSLYAVYWISYGLACIVSSFWGATTRHARALTFPPSLHKFPRVLSRSLRCAGSAAVWPALLPPPLFVCHIFKAPNGGRKSF